MVCCAACDNKETELVVDREAELPTDDAEDNSQYKEEKKREKPKLQKLLRQFAREMVEGVNLYVITGAAGVALPMNISLNKYLTVLTFTPQDPNLTAFTVELSDLRGVYKGKKDVSVSYPELGEEIADMCVGLDVRGEPDPVLFHFPSYLDVSDPSRYYQRDKFYTCIYLLWRGCGTMREKQEQEEGQSAEAYGDNTAEQTVEYGGGYDEFGNPVTVY
eukprot:Filipodium_phascolosomae@DN1507_c0_g1_i1.p1